MNQAHRVSLLSIIICLVISMSSNSLSFAQVFAPGPSDPTLFDNVLNLPTDPNIDSSFSNPATIGGFGNTEQVNVLAGGSIGDFASIFTGGEVNINGGSLGEGVEARSGSEVNINSGVLGGAFLAEIGSMVTVSGGFIGGAFRNNTGANIELIGGEYKLNGTAYSNPTITVINSDDVFTGTLADGNSFIFSDAIGSDRLIDVQLTSAALPTLDLSPIVVSSSTPSRTLRGGQTLTLLDGGDIPDLHTVDSTLNIEGGSIGSRTNAANSTVNLSSGSTDVLRAHSNSVVNISGGSIAANLLTNTGSVVNISDGIVGSDMIFPAIIEDGELNISGGTTLSPLSSRSSMVNITGGDVDAFSASLGSVVNVNGGNFHSFSLDLSSEADISGGSFSNRVTVQTEGVLNVSGGDFDGFVSVGTDSEINISGGSFDGFFRALFDSEVNLFGSEFLLDDVLLDNNLTIDEAFTISQRDATLEGLLADGTPFSFDLNSAFGFGFDPNSTLTVTLVVPEPNSMALLVLGGLSLLARRQKVIALTK